MKSLLSGVKSKSMHLMIKPDTYTAIPRLDFNGDNIWATFRLIFEEPKDDFRIIRSTGEMNNRTTRRSPSTSPEISATLLGCSSRASKGEKVTV